MLNKIAVSALSGAIMLGSVGVAFAQGGSSTGSTSGGGTTTSAPCNSVTSYKQSTSNNSDSSTSVRSTIALAKPCTTGTGYIYVYLKNETTGVETLIWRGWFTREYTFSTRYDSFFHSTSFTTRVVADGTETYLPTVTTPAL